MGNQHTGKKKDKKYFEALSKLTKFSPEEVREWRNGFMKDCPDGKLTQVKLKKYKKVRNLI